MNRLPKLRSVTIYTWPADFPGFLEIHGAKLTELTLPSLTPANAMDEPYDNGLSLSAVPQLQHLIVAAPSTPHDDHRLERFTFLSDTTTDHHALAHITVGSEAYIYGYGLLCASVIHLLTHRPSEIT